MNHYFHELEGWFKFRPAFDHILAALPRTPSTFVEIGLWYGRSTAYLGVEIVNSQKPVTLLAVDHFKGQPEIIGRRAALVADSETAFRRNIAPVADALGDRFRLLVSDSVQAAAAVPDDSVEVVWLDAAHHYEGVRAEIDAWWPKLRAGGFMGGDDFVKCEGVQQAVIERFGPAASTPAKHYWLVRRRADDSVEFLT